MEGGGGLRTERMREKRKGELLRENNEVGGLRDVKERK